MAEFSTFLDVLPNLTTGIGDAGQSGTTYGQGFVSVELTRVSDVKSDRTIGGKVIQRRQKYPMWQASFSYNQLTKSQFTPIYSFISQKQSGLRPFFVILPQYQKPKDADFATYVASNDVLTTEAKSAGQTSIEIEDTETTDGLTLPKFGDLFHFEDSENSFHTKAYMIDRVETSNTHLTAPTTGSVRIHFSPALHRDVSNGAKVVFNEPKLFVRQTEGSQPYSVDNDGLYNFSLKVEEVSY